MIKFFRGIRQRLLTENQSTMMSGRYLKYAIGEILLVMVGILLALQVNEWNNERNRKKAESEILNQLVLDLENSHKRLGRVKENFYNRARSSAIVCQAFWKKEVPHDSIYTYMLRPLSLYVYSPILGTARSLINSGNITLLKSTELKNEIITYVEKVDSRLKDISRYEETYYRGANDFMRNLYPGTWMPKEKLDQLLEESKTPSRTMDRNDEFSSRPNVIEKVPFRTDLKALFQDKEIFKVYNLLLVAHRNVGDRYGEIEEYTGELLDKLRNGNEDMD